jgi:hypothetical protein
MQLDVVHNPVVFSQFLEHTPSSADTTEAHYHFATRPGLDVDAPALLQALKDSSYQVEGASPDNSTVSKQCWQSLTCHGLVALMLVYIGISAGLASTVQANKHGSKDVAGCSH